jgi:hypothetical protein
MRRLQPNTERTTAMNRLNSKTAIVTGGAVGIGRACVIRMAEESAMREAKFVTGAEIVIDGGYTAR